MGKSVEKKTKLIHKNSCYRVFVMDLFSSTANQKDIELKDLNQLSLPSKDKTLYTSCYCEENVWKLCEYVKQHQPRLLQFCYAVFISNKNETVPLWCQKSGKMAGNLAVWDYHVIFIYQPRNDTGTVVYDLDTILTYPVELEKYAAFAFRFDDMLESCYQRYFRVIPSEIFLKTFASDRSRMKKTDGSWMETPPEYPCIATAESSNNLEDFISMDPERGVGEVMTQQQFLNRFL